MKRLIGILALLLAALLCATCAQAAGSGVNASLSQRLATRTGPGTGYDEPGSFYANDFGSQQVTVLTRSYDTRNNIWWVQVEFRVNGTKYRAYTGLKRVNVNIDRIPDEYALGTATMLCSDQALWGPGLGYAVARQNVPSGASCTVYDVENGYAQIEFYDSRVNKGCYRRAWVPVGDLSGSWGSSSSSAYGQLLCYRTYNQGRTTTTDDTLTINAADENSVSFDLFWMGISSLRDITAYYNGSDGTYHFFKPVDGGYIEGRIWFQGSLAMVCMDTVNSIEWTTKLSAVDGTYNEYVIK